MNLLKAKVNKSDTWWELELLALEICADGATEHDMLRDLERTLVAEYHLAKQQKRTPFVDLLTEEGKREAAEAQWCEGGKQFRQLNIPQEVSMALSAVLHAKQFDSVSVIQAA